MTEIIIIMGVSGAGKSTIGQALAQRLEVPFVEGDDYHPKANVDKMASGQALTDDDRWPWLSALCAQLNESTGAVATCSALKKSYRTFIERQINKKVQWVLLELDVDALEKRMQARDHFMPASLLTSQLNTLEAPAESEAIIVSSNKSPEEIVESIMSELKTDFGIIGLGVMGKSLARNLANCGIRLSLFNSHLPPNEVKVAESFQKEFAELNEAEAFDDLQPFVESLSTPRKILLMVKAGEVVDHFIESLKAICAPGDIIIDAGNSHYKDTERRIIDCKTVGIQFLGMGVSGGEKGALEGPSLMPAGAAQAYEAVAPLLLRMAAKHTDDSPCCAYLGSGGAGHFVKMVHNGIEYAEMQLIAELGSLLQHRLGFSHDKISGLFDAWNDRHLQSYLLEISAKIYMHQEEETYLLDQILDKAGNKGTGNWTTVAASELGVAIPGLTAALFARYASANKKQRMELAENFPRTNSINSSLEILKDIKAAYQFARLMNYEQGFRLLSAASASYDWKLNLSTIAKIWRAGCILRSKLVEDFSKELKANQSIFTHPAYVDTIKKTQAAIQRICQLMIEVQHASPCLQANYQYFLNSTEAQSSANVIQAQRDYFGAHRYQRKDAQGEEFFHTNWE